MTDVLMKLARVNTMKAQDAAGALNDLADEQEKQLGNKKQLRQVQQLLTAIKADGVVGRDELDKLKTEMAANGISTATIDKASADDAWDGDNMNLRNDDPNNGKVRKANGHIDAIKSVVEGALADVTDSEAMLQFHIQVGTGEMNNAESERASITKILYEHRRDLANKWGG